MIALALGAGLGVSGGALTHRWVSGGALTHRWVSGGALTHRWVSAGRHRRATDVGAAPVPPWVMVAVATVATALVAARVDPPLVVAAALYTVGAVAIAWIDADVHRIPDAILALWTPLLALAVAGAAVLEGSAAIWARAGIGAAILVGLYLVLAVVGSMGPGDVKLAAVTGMVLGASSLRALIVAIALSFALAAAAALVLLLTRRAGRSDHLAFAPALCGGAVAALAL